tara:strand:+ start:120 stop:587 length:468 start_codon:yes stop_codon:yes gene_type:complete
METFLENIFGGFFNAPKPMQTRPIVLEQMQRQMNQKQVNDMPGMFFGMGPQFTSPNVNPNSAFDPAVVNSIYTQNVGETPGVYTGTGEPTATTGILDSLSNMTPDETMNLISGVSGLLNTTQPQTMDLSPVSMPSASAGLRLQPIDLNQFYKGLI